MKKFWRCFVCNDIHYGLNPPEDCPTCRVLNAYIEVSSGEAMKIAGSATTKFDRKKFLDAVHSFAEPNEFKVNPDPERIKTLVDGIFNNEKNHGLKYCPCRLTTKDFAEDIKIVCPCNFLIHETYKDKVDGECWCGMFIKEKK